MIARLGREDGFTVVEGVVASLIFAIAAIAVLSAFDGARRATFRAEQSQVANEVAQRELEELRTKSYSQLAMTSLPGSPTGEEDPRSRVSGGEFRIARDDPESGAQMVVEGGSLDGGGVVTGGTVNPGPTAFTSGDVTGSIHRFVVWQDDPSCSNLLCPNDQDTKRVIVAVTISSTSTGGEQRYIELQSDAIDPEESIASNPNLPLLGTPTVAQQFWLSDVACTANGEPAPDPTLTSHDVHDTRGRSCSLANPPDALLTAPPENSDSSLDFATDVEPPSANSDSGLQLALPTSTGCSLLPPAILSNGRTASQTHLWVSRTTAVSGGYSMTGGATLKLWTRAIQDAMVSGDLCVVLFVRTDGTAVTPPVDVPVVNLANGSPFFTYQQPLWPTGEWEELTLQMSFAPLTVQPTQRIGLALGLRSGSADQLMFQYDNLELESRLEIETTTPIG